MTNVYLAIKDVAIRVKHQHSSLCRIHTVYTVDCSNIDHFSTSNIITIYPTVLCQYVYRVLPNRHANQYIVRLPIVSRYELSTYLSFVLCVEREAGVLRNFFLPTHTFLPFSSMQITKLMNTMHKNKTPDSRDKYCHVL